MADRLETKNGKATVRAIWANMDKRVMEEFDNSRGIYMYPREDRVIGGIVRRWTTTDVLSPVLNPHLLYTNKKC